MSLIKVKLKRKKNLIPTSSSYMGLDVPTWEKINAGEEVLINVSELLSGYVEEVKEKTKVKRK